MTWCREVAVILLATQLFPLTLTQTPSMICDSTCFGIPLGQMGCRLASQSDLPRFKCAKWELIEIAEASPYSDMPVLGEVCVDLQPISDDRVSYLGRSSRQFSEDQEGIGDVYANAKAICESFTDGSLFNPKALFKKRKCTILHMNEESKNQQDNLINNIGNVQEALAKILPQDTYYYVDAKKNESLSESYGSELYSYADTEISKLPLHHVTTTYLQSEGNCLTYSKSSSSSDSKLESVGVDCESKLMPLCFRDIGASDLSFINDQCGDCDDFSETPSCNKWSTLEECYEPGDPFKVVSDVKICTDMCGPLVREEQEYCSDVGGYLFNYEKFDLQITDYKTYFGADNIENFETEWRDSDKTSVSGVDPEYLNTSSVLFVKKSTANSPFTIGNLVARLLTKSYTGENSTLETFWVDLENQDIYCYDPCPASASGDCCSIEGPKTTLSEVKISENSEPIPTSIKKYNWFTWVNKYDNKITLVQDYTENQNSIDCGALDIKNDKQLDFFRENCKAKHRPLCMKEGSTIEFVDAKRKRKSHKKKKTRKSQKKNTKRGKQSSGRQGRQLTDTGRPIEMCATVLPALVGVCYFWPSLCSDSETVTSTETVTTEVPDYNDYEEYDYDYDNDNAV